jgi:hypothetical protein
MRAPRKASSQVSWSLLTEGVTQARLEAHRLRLMLDRAMALVHTSPEREHLWQVGGDLIQGFPERLSDLERALDRTSYALVVMGEDFLRGRIPADDRYVVDEATKTHPYAGPRTKEDSLASRVARRHMAAKGAAPSAEHWFFDNPEKRETREFAETGALSNLPPTAAKAVKEFESPDRTVGEAKLEAKISPPPPLKIEKKPGGKQFSTLNRFVVETEQPKAGKVPQGREDIPKAKKVL